MKRERAPPRHHPKPSAVFEFKREPKGGYTDHTLGRALLLKRSNPAAWRKLPDDLRRQAEDTVKELSKRWEEAQVFMAGYELGQNQPQPRAGRPPDRERAQRIADLYNQGVSQGEIARRLGIPYNRVRAFVSDRKHAPRR